MSNYDPYDILVATIAYNDGTGSKRRLALVIAHDGEMIRT